MNLKAISGALSVGRLVSTASELLPWNANVEVGPIRTYRVVPVCGFGIDASSAKGNPHVERKRPHVAIARLVLHYVMHLPGVRVLRAMETGGWALGQYARLGLYLCAVDYYTITGP